MDKNHITLKIKSFTDLIAWQKAHELSLRIYKETRSFPQDELYGLTSQIRRAVVSVTSNIAEGFSRSSSKEKTQFYRTALASLTEVHSQLILSKDLHYITENSFNEIVTLLDKVGRLMTGLIRSQRMERS